MKLWLISQSVNNYYDTYDSAVIAAKTEADARETHPSESTELRWLPNEQGTFCWAHIRPDGTRYYPSSNYSDWTVPANVKVELLGNAKKGMEASVICASFNAG